MLSTEKTKILVLFPEIDSTFASGTQFDSTVNWNKNGIRTQGEGGGDDRGGSGECCHGGCGEGTYEKSTAHQHTYITVIGQV